MAQFGRADLSYITYPRFEFSKSFSTVYICGLDHNEYKPGDVTLNLHVNTNLFVE